MKRVLQAMILALSLGVTSMMANDGAAVYKGCMGCHGANGGMKAMGKSEVITGWPVEKTVAALKGYKDGSYGKQMKALMKNQADRLTDAQIQAVAEHIATLK